MLGMAFGLVRGGIVVLVFVAIVHYALPVQEDDWYQQSRLIPELIVLIEEFWPVVWEQGELLMQDDPAQET